MIVRGKGDRLPRSRIGHVLQPGAALSITYDNRRHRRCGALVNPREIETHVSRVVPNLVAASDRRSSRDQVSRQGLSALLVGCGDTKQQAGPAQEAEPAAIRAQIDTGPQYTVQELPGSVVEGRVLLEGTPPPPKTIQVMENVEICGTTRQVYAVRVENGGVDDAVVWIDDIQRGKRFSFHPAQIEQKNCAFVPNIVIMRAGELKINSQDPIPHNVHTYAHHNREYNESMNRSRRDISLSFPHPDIISIRCDLHEWMQAYAVIAKNPYYAISENGGTFKLDGVPPGRYHLMVWSKSLGESEQEIVVETGKPTKADFNLKSQAARDSGVD